MVEGVLSLAERTVKTIMTPRCDVVWIDLEHPASEIAALIKREPHSCYPVCEGQRQCDRDIKSEGFSWRYAQSCGYCRYCSAPSCIGGAGNGQCDWIDGGISKRATITLFWWLTNSALFRA